MKARRPAALAWIFLVLGSLTGAASCRQLVGVTERAACNGITSTLPECASCTSDACCEAVLECRDDPPCADAANCLTACQGDTDCRVACRDAMPGGFGDSLSALLACEGSACVSECETTCGGYVYATSDCAQCAIGACCPEASACGASPECLALSSCAWSCASDDAKCRGDCLRSHEPGQEAARALSDCLEANCFDVCDAPPFVIPGVNWSCAEKPIDWGSCDGTVTAEFGFSSFIDEAGWPDVLVKACAADDIDCASPLAEGATNAMGIAMLSIPCDFEGYFRAEGGGSAQAPDQPLTTLLVMTIPYHAKPAISGSVAIVTYTQYAQYFSPVAPIEDGKGHLFLVARDCDVGAAGAVSFALDPPDPNAVPYFGDDGSVPGPTTNVSGSGGFLNVTPGVYRVRVIRHDVDPPVCVAAPEVIVLPDAETDIHYIIPDATQCP